jgi:hypothetical protein
VYQTGTSIYIWNIESNTNRLFPNEPARDFDIVASATTNELYIWIDVSTTNSIRRYVSVDGGATWGNAALVTSNGAHPRVSISTGDTVTLNYYGPVLADTATSVIRLARYRRSGVGTLTSMAFIDIVTGNARKEQFGATIFGGRVWFFYTVGDSTARDIRCRVSSDNGATFGTEFDLAANPTAAEISFDMQRTNDGCSFVYISDSAGTTKLMYTSATTGSPSTFSPALNVSQFAPASSSSAGYLPTLVPFGDSLNDAGIVWVGQNRRVYWDRLHLGPVGVEETPESRPRTFELRQNYPNPFNPTTRITYALPEEATASLTIYNMLGQEVITLANSHQPPGHFDVTWDGCNGFGTPVGSGVYFYRLDAKGTSGRTFTSYMKMLLLK